MTDDAARRVADELRRRGLAPVARLLVDAHRPLGPLLADTGAALGPMLAAVGGPGVESILRLADEDGLDRLATELGSPGERRAEPG